MPITYQAPDGVAMVKGLQNGDKLEISCVNHHPIEFTIATLGRLHSLTVYLKYIKQEPPSPTITNHVFGRTYTESRVGKKNATIILDPLGNIVKINSLNAKGEYLKDFQHNGTITLEYDYGKGATTIKVVNVKDTLQLDVFLDDNGPLIDTARG